MPEASSTRPFLKSITLNQLLSFGNPTTIELGQLNVLIGPNGVGKSNLIEAIALLREMSQDLNAFFLKGGGADAWVFRGAENPAFGLKALVEKEEGGELLHEIEFVREGMDYRISREMVDSTGEPTDLALQPENTRGLASKTEGLRPIEGEIHPQQSILRQGQGQEQHAELASLQAFYAQISIYREWQFGPRSSLRQPQVPKQRSGGLLEDFSNLGSFLNELLSRPETKQKLVAYLQLLSPEIQDLQVAATQDRLEIVWEEQSGFVPVTRLSDGALRYLCLIAMLCNPNPPPLICIEAPELGLHPDMIPMLSDLLVEASERTQLIVTTHSDILIDTFTERPEVVLVCEKKEGQTQIKRLDAEELRPKLEEHSLGKLWMDGSIGGTRW